MAKKPKQVHVSEDGENSGSGDGENSGFDDVSAECENRRGRTVLALVGKEIQMGIKIPLKWNHNNVPTGVNRENFATYIGVVVRERVSINYRQWDEVLEADKNEVYEHITKGFVVPDERKNYVLGRASIRWRAFKARLRKDWMYDTVGEDKNQIIRTPPSIYPWIKQSDWDKFIDTYTDPKFKELSNLNRERVKKKTSSYRGGRKGYLYYEEEIAKELKKQKIKANDIPRHLVWLRAHCRYENDVMYFDNPADFEVAQAKALVDQQLKGDIEAKGRNDILGMAFKTPEHGGCVRGVGSGVTNKQYFGYNKPTPPSQVQYELLMVKAKLAKMENNQNLLMSYILLGEFNPEHVKQLFFENSNQPNHGLRGDGFGLTGLNEIPTSRSEGFEFEHCKSVAEHGIQGVQFQLTNHLYGFKEGASNGTTQLNDHVSGNKGSMNSNSKGSDDRSRKEGPIETYRVHLPQKDDVPDFTQVIVDHTFTKELQVYVLWQLKRMNGSI